MGKSKQQPKTKGNLKPASSSRAAETSIGQTNTSLSFTNLGGFAQFASPATTSHILSRPSTPGSDGGDISIDIDPELSVILKKINKRDSITKLKALEELNTYLNEHISVIQSIVSTWVSIYNKVALDVDRRVRLAGNQIHQLVTLQAKKKLAPYLKDFIGVWMLNMYDQSKDVAKLAKLTFEAVFAEDKRQGVIVFCQKDILDYTSEMLLIKTVETLSDARYVSPEDMAAKYARVMASSLYTLSHLITSLPEDERIKVKNDYDALFDTTALWKFVTHESPVIRRSIYHLIKNLLVHWPAILESRLDLICPDFFGTVFGDKDASVHSEMWDALLLMTKKYPDSWMIINKKKPALSKLCNFLRNGLNGSLNIAYPSMIALLANLPSQLMNSPNFYKDVFTNFWKGLSSSIIDKSNSHVLVNAYCECVTYFAITKSTTNPDATAYLVDSALYDALRAYFIRAKDTAIAYDKLNEQCGIYFGNNIITLIKSEANIPMSSLWSKLDTLCVQIIIDCDGPAGSEVDMSLFCQQIGMILSCIHKQLQGTGSSSIDYNNPAYTPVGDLVQRLFVAALDSCFVHKDFASELIALDKVLLHDYATIILKCLDTGKVSKQLLSLLDQVAVSSIPTVVSTFVSLISNVADESMMKELWNSITGYLVTLNSKDGTLRQINGLASLLDEIYIQKPQINYQSENLDILVKQVSSDILTSSPVLVQNQNEQDATLQRTIMEKVFVQSLSLQMDYNLLSEETLQVVLSSLVPTLKSFNQYYYSTEGNINKQSLDSSSNEDAINYSTRSVLSIILALLEPKDVIAVKFLTQFSLSDLPNQVFDAMFAKPVEALSSTASSVGNDNQLATTDDTIGDIQLLAGIVWTKMIDLMNNNDSTDKEIQTKFRHGVLTHVKSSITDVKCIASPLESVNRSNKLLSALYPDTTTTEYQQALTTLVGDSAKWIDLYATFQEKRTLEYMASSVTDIYAGMDSQTLWEDKDELYPIQYDIYGLSALGRLALFTSAFIIQKQVDVVRFFNVEDTKDIYDRDTLLRIMLLVSMECSRGFEMNGLCRIWQSSTLYTPATTSTTILSPSKNALRLGITDFITQTNTIFNAWFDHMVKNQLKSSPSMTTHFCTSLYNSLKKGSITDDDNGRLFNFTLNSLRHQGQQYTDAYYAIFIQTLMDQLLDQYQWTIKEVEQWLPILKAEATEVSPLIKAALITSFKKVIGETSGYQYLSSDFANKLSGADSLQIFADRPEAWEWLTLLNASSITFGTLPIPPQRLIYLVSTIKGWFKQDFDDHLEVIHRKKIHIQLALLFSSISESVQEVSGSHWDLFLDCVYEWLSYNDADEYDDLPIMYYALRLLSRLIDLGTEGNSNILETLNDHWKGIGNAVWKCFTKEKGISLPISQSRKLYQELLAGIVNYIPFVILKEIVNFGEVIQHLGSTNDVLQKQAFFILQQLVKEDTKNLSVQLEFSQHEEDKEEKLTTRRIHPDLFKRLITNEPILSMWDIATVEEKEFHEIFGYMLSWLLMFEHFDDITFKLKQQYTAELKDAEALDKLIPFLFKFLNPVTGQPAFDLTPWDFSIYDLEGFDITMDTSYALLAGHLYYQTLRHIPSLARQWWVNYRQRQLVIAVEQYTEKYFSGLLIDHEMALVNRADIKKQLEDNDNEFKVKTLKAGNEVSAIYNVDEQEMRISIKLPNNYPLQQIQVEGVQKVGVSDKQWRGWMFAIAAVIGSQNGNIVDALTVCKRNINLHFEGIGDCVICYSIISVQDRSIPTKQCRTCKNKFHASCLYKWFRSSNSASCPLCRTVF
ncbi:uncharacterized protein BX664DRAFT_338835 [Halteromyces radiatus]|uniref:uncharacterized protein n=1 Tax=Halteromyces radiatus TaxID=101107 RepID=UPI00221E6330|nr:uncharacterized protein BX664DRAFT_338835 [Halteromyces radiatus]KAI8085215.1 hypothetical protein BX664DRAFT_338835 [Halteromyces radiatus]